MRPTRLLQLDAVLLAVALAVVGLLSAQSKLAWSWNALRLYLDGQTTTPRELLLEREALSLLQVGGDADEIRDLLEQSIAIDPNSRAVHLLGDLYLREGEVEAAVGQYRRYLEINPSFLPGYLRLSEVYGEAGRTTELTALLERGVAYYESEVERFRPRIDDEYYEAYNDKAVGVYNGYREALRLLRERLAALAAS